MPVYIKKDYQPVSHALQQSIRLTNANKLSGIPSWSQIEMHFRTEETTRDFLISEGILTPLTHCLACDSPLGRCDSKGRLRCYACKRNGKEWTQSIYNGTFFEGFRSNEENGGKRELIRFIHNWLCGATVNFQRKTLGWSNRKVADWTRTLQELIAVSVLNDTEPIGGPGIVVEIDESKFGKRKYNRGHRVEGAWVFGGVENTPERRFFAVIVEKRDRKTLMPLIKKFIAPGSIIMSDQWGAYNQISDQEGYDYTHQTVNHSKEFVDSETGACTNTVEGTWSAVKSKVPARKRNKRELQNCLFEFIWRRTNEGNLWNAILKALSEVRYA